MVLQAHKFRMVALLVFAISVPAFAKAPAAPAATPTAIPPPPFGQKNCEREADALKAKLTVDTPFQAKAPIMDLDPAKLCAASKDSPMNRRIGAESIEEARICENAYIKTQAAITEYRTAMIDACTKVNDIAKGCDKEPNPTACMAKKANDAAAASEKAAKLLADARTQVNQLQAEAKKASDVYKKDQTQIINALRKINQDIERAEADNRADEAAKLKAQRDTATVIRGGRLMNEGGLLDTLNPDSVAANRGNRQTPTITSYVAAIPRNGDQAGLQLEQETAARTAKAFSDGVKLEIDNRNAATTAMRSYATQLTSISTRQVDPITSGAVKPPAATTGSSITSPNALTNMTNAAKAATAATQAAQAAAAGGTSAASQAAAAQLASNAAQGYPTALSHSANASEASGKDASRLAQVVNPKETPEKTDNKEKPISLADNTFRGNDGGFVSGLNDLPPMESGSSASRTLASAKAGNVGSSGGVDVSSSGKKKKGATESQSCGSDKECMAAMGVETSQFNKAGSLGVPVLGSADTGLGSLASLDNLFGPLPGDQPGITSAGAIPTLASLGVEQSGPGEIYTPASGVQAAVEMAPANSRSLFVRVRAVHEKAIKRGAVSLFHKKL